MKLAAWFSVLVPLCLSMLIAAPDAAAVQLSFSIYALGLPVAESHMTFDLTSTTYGMGLRYQTIGVAKLFAGDRLDQTSKGTFQRDQPVPLEFRSFVRLHG